MLANDTLSFWNWKRFPDDRLIKTGRYNLGVINVLYILVLLLVMVVDWRQYRIPNSIVLPGTLLAFVVAFLDSGDAFLSAVLGTAVAFLLFLVLYIVGQRFFGDRALGFGDVKLALMLGAMLGIHAILPALALGMLLGGLVSGWLLYTGRAARGDIVPYGVFLAFGGIITLLGMGFFGVQ